MKTTFSAHPKKVPCFIHLQNACTEMNAIPRSFFFFNQELASIGLAPESGKKMCSQ